MELSLLKPLKVLNFKFFYITGVNFMDLHGLLQGYIYFFLTELVKFYVYTSARTRARVCVCVCL
jgi:hypothetical protein